MALLVITILCLYVFNTANSQGLTILSNPTTIQIGLTSDLDITCLYQPSINDQSVLSVILSRKMSNESTFTDIASIDGFTNKASKTLQFMGEVSGHVDQMAKSPSNLTTSFYFPGPGQAAEYKCSASTLDKSGQPQTVDQTLSITSGNPTRSAILQEVNVLQEETRNCSLQIKTGGFAFQRVAKILKQFTAISSIAVYKRHFYVLMFRRASFYVTGLQQECINAGGYLLEINDVNEYNFVNATLLGNPRRHSYIEYVKIGLTRASSSSPWKNMNNTNDPVYTKWKTGEPSTTRSYNYVEMRPESGTFYAMVAYENSDSKCHFVCEFPM